MGTRLKRRRKTRLEKIQEAKGMSKSLINESNKVIVKKEDDDGGSEK